MSSKNVFILGAGFSKDIAGYPILSDLTKQLIDSIKSSGNDILKNYINRDVPELIQNNIEELLSYLYQDNPWRSEKDNNLLRYLYFNVAEMIVKILSQVENDKAEAAFSKESTKQLIEYWHKWESTVITFNYDTLVERLVEHYLKVKRLSESIQRGRNFGLLHQLDVEIIPEKPENSSISNTEIEWSPESKHLKIYLPTRDVKVQPLLEIIKAKSIFGGNDELLKRDTQTLSSLLERLSKPIIAAETYQIPIANVKSRTAALWAGEKSPTLKLLKLHGSINWLYSGSKDYSGEQLYYDNLNELEKDVASKNKIDLVPLIIPPLLDKTAFYAHSGIRIQWQQAKHAIEDAENIFIIGYSLPETDLSTRFLLQESLLQSRGNVHVVTKNDGMLETLKNRYEKMFPGRVTFHSTDNSSTELLMKSLNI